MMIIGHFVLLLLMRELAVQLSRDDEDSRWCKLVPPLPRLYSILSMNVLNLFTVIE